MWADWYKKGIIKRDFAVMDGNAVKEDIINGKVGVHPYYQWWGYGYGPDLIKNNNPDAYFDPYSLRSSDGEPVKYGAKFPNESYMVVNNKAKNPQAAEALIKLINYYNYIVVDGGASGEMTLDDMLPYTANQMAHVTGPFRIQNPLGERSQYEEVQEARKTGDTSIFTTGTAIEKYDGTMKWFNEGDPLSIGFVLQLGGDRSAYGLSAEVLDSGRLVKSKLWGAQPEVLNNYGSTLNDLLMEGFTKIIMGAESVDYFDMLVENWKMAGGTEVTAAVNEMYGK